MRILYVFLSVFCALAMAQPPGAGDVAADTAAAGSDTAEVGETPAPVEEPPEPAPASTDVDAEEVERQQSASMNLKDLFIAGGNFMWPLLLALLIGIAVAIERFVTFSRAKIDVGRFLEQIGGYLRKGDLRGAEDLCDRTRGPVASVLRAGLLRRDKGLESVEKAIDSAGGIEMAFLEKRIVVLASVASIAPMLGFLGTVSGMIRAFGEIAAAKNVEASLVAGGIQEALITTASGLTIAIPIQAAHHYFIARIGGFVTDMEEASGFLMDTLADMEQLKQL
jgi:biopolymer transport protein ExbB